MMYFEDALWIRENFWRDAIGTLYFVLGITGIASHIVLISILPEISNFVSRSTILLLYAQFTASAIQLIVVFVPVPAMIATNKPYFINPIMINVPAFVLVVSQCFAFIFMMMNSVYRSLRSISSKAGKFFFDDKFIFAIMVIVTGVSFFFAVNICAHTRIRCFNPNKLNWKLQYFEVISFIYLVAAIMIPTSIFSFVALLNLSYRKLFLIPNPSGNNGQEEAEFSRETICTSLVYIIFEYLFAFWIFMSFLSSTPFLSMAHVFLTAYWPFLMVVTLDIHIRSALIYRIRGVFQPHSTNSPIMIRSNSKGSGKLSKF